MARDNARRVLELEARAHGLLDTGWGQASCHGEQEAADKRQGVATRREAIRREHQKIMYSARCRTSLDLPRSFPCHERHTSADPHRLGQGEKSPA